VAPLLEHEGAGADGIVAEVLPDLIAASGLTTPFQTMARLVRKGAKACFSRNATVLSSTAL
jgi:hypothetical protein